MDTTITLALIGLAAIVLNGIVGIITLIVANKTHKVANSRLTETIDKVDLLTAALATSKEQTRVAEADQQVVPRLLQVGAP